MTDGERTTTDRPDRADDAPPSRRAFLSEVGAAALPLLGAPLVGVPLVGASLAGAPGWAFAQSPVDRGQTTPGGAGQPPAVRFPPLYRPSERREGQPPNPHPPGERVGYALVGLGRLALEEILPALAGECTRSRAVALVTGDAAKGRAVARQYGLDERRVYGYADLARLADAVEVEAVYIATPNDQHAEQTAAAAAAGKHVLCEKPMATSTAEAERMVQACARAGRKLMVAYRIQYEPHNRAAMRMVRESGPGRGPLGKVSLIELANAQAQGTPDQWRLRRRQAGGGALPDIGIYCYNTARFLTGEEPVEVRALEFSTPGDARFREVEETVLWTMRFPSGTLAHCACSYGGHTNKRYRVSGEDGYVELDPGFAYRGLRMTVGRAAGGTPVVEERQLDQRVSQFAREIDHFSDCIRQDRRPYTPGEEGVQDHRVQDAIYRAAREGRPVALPAAAQRDAFRGPPPAEERA